MQVTFSDQVLKPIKAFLPAYRQAEAALCQAQKNQRELSKAVKLYRSLSDLSQHPGLENALTWIGDRASIAFLYDSTEIFPLDVAKERPNVLFALTYLAETPERESCCEGIITFAPENESSPKHGSRSFREATGSISNQLVPYIISKICPEEYEQQSELQGAISVLFGDLVAALNKLINSNPQYVEIENMEGVVIEKGITGFLHVEDYLVKILLTNQPPYLIKEINFAPVLN